MHVTRIGGPTILVELDGWRILIDPTFDPPGRRYPFALGTSSVKTRGPALDPAELGAIDIVLVSHDHHADNLDTAGRAILPTATHVLTTTSGARRLSAANTRGLAAGETTHRRRPRPTSAAHHRHAVPARTGTESRDRRRCHRFRHPSRRRDNRRAVGDRRLRALPGAAANRTRPRRRRRDRQRRRGRIPAHRTAQIHDDRRRRHPTHQRARHHASPSPLTTTDGLTSATVKTGCEPQSVTRPQPLAPRFAGSQTACPSTSDPPPASQTRKEPSCSKSSGEVSQHSLSRLRSPSSPSPERHCPQPQRPQRTRKR